MKTLESNDSRVFLFYIVSSFNWIGHSVTAREIRVRISTRLQIGKVRAVGLSSAVLKTVGPSGVWVRVSPFPQILENKLIWWLGPPAKRVVRSIVWGSIPLFSANGRWTNKVVSHAWKALGTERYWFRILLLPHITIKKLNYGINL